MWPEVWGAKGHSASRLVGQGCGQQKGLVLSLRADKGPKEVPGLGSPQGALGPSGSSTRMGGYASIQDEVGEGQTAPPAGTSPLGAAEPVGGVGEGRAGLVGCNGSTVGDGGKETEGEKGRGSPWSRAIRLEMRFCRPQGKGGLPEARQGAREEGPLVCQAGDGGWAVGCLWPGGSRLMGFGSITWSKSGRGERVNGRRVIRGSGPGST